MMSGNLVQRYTRAMAVERCRGWNSGATTSTPTYTYIQGPMDGVVMQVTDRSICTVPRLSEQTVEQQVDNRENAMHDRLRLYIHTDIRR